MQVTMYADCGGQPFEELGAAIQMWILAKLKDHIQENCPRNVKVGDTTVVETIHCVICDVLQPCAYFTEDVADLRKHNTRASRFNVPARRRQVSSEWERVVHLVNTVLNVQCAPECGLDCCVVSTGLALGFSHG